MKYNLDELVRLQKYAYYRYRKELKRNTYNPGQELHNLDGQIDRNEELKWKVRYNQICNMIESQWNQFYSDNL